VEPQVCITADNVQVTVDGILYLKVIDPRRRATASRTTARDSVPRKDDQAFRNRQTRVDRTFSERDAINFPPSSRRSTKLPIPGGSSHPLRDQDISPADSTLKALEQQMRAERRNVRRSSSPRG
jgi:regulator of protease activity HflC (stomatin/prohibitin superfamily)